VSRSACLVAIVHACGPTHQFPHSRQKRQPRAGQDLLHILRLSLDFFQVSRIPHIRSTTSSTQSWLSLSPSIRNFPRVFFHQKRRIVSNAFQTSKSSPLAFLANHRRLNRRPLQRNKTAASSSANIRWRSSQVLDNEPRKNEKKPELEPRPQKMRTRPAKGSGRQSEISDGVWLVDVIRWSSKSQHHIISSADKANVTA